MTKLFFRGCACGVFAILLAVSAARAQDFSVDLTAASVLYDSSGDPLPTSRLVLLVGDTGNNGFNLFLGGSSLTVGSFLNADDQILGTAATTSTGFAQSFFSSIPIDSGAYSNLETGDPLAVVWFSLLTGASSTLSAGNTYGLFSNSVTTDDGGYQWIVPSGGSTIVLSFLTTAADNDSTHAESEGHATLTAIPEPSTYAAITGACMLGLALWRRQRRHSVREIRLHCVR